MKLQNELRTEKKDIMRDRLQKIIGNEKPFAWAKRIGIPSATFSRMWNEGVSPKSDVLLIISEKTGVSIDWLLTGKGPMNRTIDLRAKNERSSQRKSDNSSFIKDDESIHPLIPQWEDPDPLIFDFIPMAKTTLSAGGGAFVLSEEFEGYYAFRKTWLHSITTSRNNLVLMRVTGDSMAPTIQSRDTVMIDIGRREIKEGEIYALRADSTVMIKRLSFRPNNKVLIISDNKNEFSPYEAAISDIHILGQVIFFSRVLIQDRS